MAEETVERCASCGGEPSGLRLYTLAEAAALIRVVNTRQLTEMLKDNDISGYKVGRKWCLSEDDIRAFLESCRRPACAKRTIGSGGQQKARTSPPAARPTTRSVPAPQGQISLFGGGGDSAG